MHIQIQSIKLKNFKAFRDFEMTNIPKFCVLVGENGTGKSTLFKLFGFLREALAGNVTTALAHLGGNRGFDEVRSRGSMGNIEIEIKFKSAKIISKKGTPVTVTYFLEIGKDTLERVVVKKEILQYRRGKKGQPWQFLNFSEGSGYAVTNEFEGVAEETDLKREAQSVKDPAILAIKGLSQFERFPAVVELGNLIERWHISDFHINRARPEQEVGFANHLSSEGENLSLVIEYLQKNHPETFHKILKKLSERVPGITKVESKVTEEGRVLLRFQDGAFEDPFLARYVSDGTIKMLAYLVLLHDPNPHPLLCVEEPENQLYPHLLEELAEEFRDYANRSSQVFVSTHSPDFLNAASIEEVFWLAKEAGYSKIYRAKDNPQLVGYMGSGDRMGALWKRGFFRQER